MKTLYSYIEQEKVNEGLIKAGLSLATLNKISPSDLLEGILSMYDYIVDEDDINLFFRQYQLKDQAFWRNLYELYSKGLLSIIDAKVDSSFFNSSESENKDRNSEEKLIHESFPVLNQLIKVTPEFRRNLRKLINSSRNSKLNLKPSEPDQIIAVEDKVNNTILILTINRTSSIFKTVFRVADKKWLEKVLTKLGEG